MQLKTSDQTLDEPTLEDVKAVVKGLRGKPDHFAILSKSDLTYLQTSTDISYLQVASTKTSGFVLEYQGGSADEHYQAMAPLRRNQVLQALEWYLQDDNRWISAFIWTKMPLGSGAGKSSRQKESSKEPTVGVNLNLKKALQIFGLEAGATKEQLQKRYREMIGKCHPDRVNHLDNEFQKLAEEKTKLLNGAYKLLDKILSVQ